MNLKYKKLLLVAAIIDIVIGIFLLVCGVLEFTGIINTDAHNVTETIGVHVSYLVFLSAIFLLSTGTLSIFLYRSEILLNLQVLLGVVSLAWPLFLQISLFFTQLTINIRLIISVLTSLFYVIAVLIVKITNDEFVKTTKFNPSAIISQSGKRVRSVNLEAVFNKSHSKAHKVAVVQSVAASFTNTSKPRRRVNLNFKRLFTGRRHSGVRLGKRFYSGSRKRTSHALNRMTDFFSILRIGGRRR